jgi:hypothetical protein
MADKFTNRWILFATVVGAFFDWPGVLFVSICGLIGIGFAALYKRVRRGLVRHA